MKSIITIAILAISCFAVGQEAKISLDRSAMRIGEQTVLHLYFTYQNPNGTALIVWPNYEGNLTDDIEIVKQSLDEEILLDSTTATFQREQKLLPLNKESTQFLLKKLKWVIRLITQIHSI